MGVAKSISDFLKEKSLPPQDYFSYDQSIFQRVGMLFELVRIDRIKNRTNMIRHLH